MLNVGKALNVLHTNIRAGADVLFHARRWTESLSVFMKSLHAHFVRQPYLEHLAKGASADVDMEDAYKDRLAYCMAGAE